MYGHKSSYNQKIFKIGQIIIDDAYHQNWGKKIPVTGLPWDLYFEWFDLKTSEYLNFDHFPQSDFSKSLVNSSK